MFFNQLEYKTKTLLEKFSIYIYVDEIKAGSQKIKSNYTLYVHISLQIFCVLQVLKEKNLKNRIYH
jgi:hypothetical protein